MIASKLYMFVGSFPLAEMGVLQIGAAVRAGFLIDCHKLPSVSVGLVLVQSVRLQAYRQGILYSLCLVCGSLTLNCT